MTERMMKFLHSCGTPDIGKLNFIANYPAASVEAYQSASIWNTFAGAG